MSLFQALRCNQGEKASAKITFVSSASRASGCIGDLAGADESHMFLLSWRDETTIHHRVMAHELEPFVDLIMFATRSLFRIRGIAAVPAFPLCDLPGAPSVAVLFCSVGVCRGFICVVRQPRVRMHRGSGWR